MGLIGSLLADEKKKRRDQFAAGQDWEMSALPTKKERLDESIGQIGKGAASLGSTTLDILHQLGRLFRKLLFCGIPTLLYSIPAFLLGRSKKLGLL